MLLLVTVILTLCVSWARGQEITCDPPIIPNSDFASKLNKYRLDDVITYQCRNGFSHPPLLGNTTKCTLLGWVPRPRCVPKPCDFTEIKHGRLYWEDSITPHFPASVGQSFPYSCDKNYVRHSQFFWASITCTPEGWFPKVACRRKCVFNDSEHEQFPFKVNRMYKAIL
ncbi:complement factor H-like [Myotis daubentonii]|uniref:complement factor H-like n=1 Tax=Myotis daubentonii TaxID=98922 RepID=UPI002873E4FD|nr:complement factor H-like [Myotis daubentonii]